MLAADGPVTDELVAEPIADELAGFEASDERKGFDELAVYGDELVPELAPKLIPELVRAFDCWLVDGSSGSAPAAARMACCTMSVVIRFWMIGCVSRTA